MATPYSLLVLEEVASTQDLARERARPDRPAVVVAHRQTRGRGRGGAEWETAPRAIAVSIGTVSTHEASFPSPVPLVAGVAARRVLGDAVALKWPNDLLAGDDKVGGILVEATSGTVVAGMGLNLFWPDAPFGTGALYRSDPGPEEGPAVAGRWAEELLGLLAQNEWPRREYEKACVTLGREITWEPEGRGTAVGIGPDGTLEVITPEGSRRFLAAGNIRHLRPI